MQILNEVTIAFRVNGQETRLTVPAHETLLDVLRERLLLTGTKESCREGECGACTVLVNGRAVNSCLMLAAEADGCDILTIEGLQRDGQLDLLQEAFMAAGAVQCGFCTPGMIMSAKALLMRNPNPTAQQVKEALCGNLCRCTGYTRIISAVLTAAGRMRRQGQVHTGSEGGTDAANH